MENQGHSPSPGGRSEQRSRAIKVEEGAQRVCSISKSLDGSGCPSQRIRAAQIGVVPPRIHYTVGELFNYWPKD